MFSLQPPLAYFLTWTTYGTRLFGDPRGSVDRDRNKLYTAKLEPNELLVADAQRLMTQPSLVLNDQQRLQVDKAVRDHCGIRGWMIHALNVRTNHVHVVVTANSHKPEAAMAQFKSWGTRRLISAGFVDRDRKVWTDHGSTRWLNRQDELDQAIEYVRHCQ